MSKVQEDAEIRTSDLYCASAGAVCFAEHLTQRSPNSTAVPSSLQNMDLSPVMHCIFLECTYVGVAALH